MKALDNWKGGRVFNVDRDTEPNWGHVTTLLSVYKCADGEIIVQCGRKAPIKGAPSIAISTIKSLTRTTTDAIAKTTGIAITPRQDRNNNGMWERMTLATWMSHKGMPLQTLAEECGYATASLSRILNGKRDVPLPLQRFMLHVHKVLILPPRVLEALKKPENHVDMDDFMDAEPEGGWDESEEQSAIPADEDELEGAES